MDKETTQRVIEFIGTAKKFKEDFITNESGSIIIESSVPYKSEIHVKDLNIFILEAINEKIEREKIMENNLHLVKHCFYHTSKQCDCVKYCTHR